MPIADRASHSTAGGRLILAFEMADFGIALMRENLRRRFPLESPADVERLLAIWLAGPDPREVVAAATAESVPGLGALPVATCGHLIALKLLSRKEQGRPNDVPDIDALLKAATAEDLEQARAACALIVERGFQRGRDLVALLRKASTGRKTISDWCFRHPASCKS